MNKYLKILLTTLLLILFSTIFVLVTVKAITMTDWFKITKANNMFGDEMCKCHLLEPRTWLPAFDDWQCDICEDQERRASITGEKICYTCSKITNRCLYCGKLKK